MSAADTCPESAELVQLLRGRLSIARTTDLERHLEDCDCCLNVVEKLHLDSPVLHALKTPPHADTPIPQDLEELMARLEEMHPALSGRDSASKTGTEGNDFPLLARGEAPGELGRLGHFRILELLGAGGMGVVYLAWDEKLQRTVALKTLRPSTARDPDARGRFLREAQAMASIQHDHIVVVHEVGEALIDGDGGPGTPYLAMQLLAGESLQAWTTTHPRPPLAWVVRLGRHVAEALAALHARGLIHRDVKPANLWLEPPPPAGAKVQGKTRP